MTNISNLFSISRVNHIAIAVDCCEQAALQYQQAFLATTKGPDILPEHGVKVMFVEYDNTKIELLEAYGDESPIANFMANNPKGGMHHICYEVDNIDNAIKHLQQEGYKILGDGKPKIGAHGLPVIFMHPKDFHGVLIELEEHV